MKPFPDFVIAGAAKAGTTALHAILNQHPSIYFSPIKEPHFFSKDIDPTRFNPNFRANTSIDLDRYFKQYPLPQRFQAFIRSTEHYQRLFEDADPQQITAEASTSYLYSEEAAANLKAYNPNAKVLILLRNPVERAYSHYLMALKFGFTDKSFQNALIADKNKKRKGWGQSELFLELGCYYQQVKRFKAAFPDHQLFIAYHEDFVASPENLLNQLTQWLGLEPFHFDYRVDVNSADHPRAPRLNALLNKLGLRLKLGYWLPDRLKPYLKPFFLKQPTDYQGMPPVVKRYLQMYYRYDVEQLANLNQHSLTNWLN